MLRSLADPCQPIGLHMYLVLLTQEGVTMFLLGKLLVVIFLVQATIDLLDHTMH